MARPTQDLAGALFGEPWQARDRFGIPIKPPTWRMIATFPDGTRLTIARRGSTDAEAFERIDALRRRPHGARAGTKWTMQSVWEDWWTWSETESSGARKALADGATSRSPLKWQDATRVRYKGIWTNHLASKWGHREPGSLTRAEIYEWLREPRKVQPKMLLDALRVVCRHAEDRGVAPFDPTRGGFSLPQRRPTPRPLTTDQLDTIEEHLRCLTASSRQPDGMRLHDGWVIMRSTGARLSEMLALQVRDFDPHSGTLYIGRRHIAKQVTANGTSTLGVVEGTKTKAGVRRVPVTPVGSAVLEARCDGRSPSDFVLSDQNGRWVSTNAFSNALRREMRRIGIDATAHDLRDTLSTIIAHELVQRRGYQAGLAAAARHLGHSSPKSLPAYVDESQVIDTEIASIVADTDLRARRMAEILAIGGQAGFTGYRRPDVRDDGETIVVRVDDSDVAWWRAALVSFGNVRVEAIDYTSDDISF